MRKFILAVLLLFVTANIANARPRVFLEDDEGFTYISSYDYILFSPGNRAGTCYDLGSIEILEDSDDYFEFSIKRVTIQYNDASIIGEDESIFSENLNTDEIFLDDESIDNGRFFNPVSGKTHREIYEKIKSVALED